MPPDRLAEIKRLYFKTTRATHRPRLRPRHRSAEGDAGRRTPPRHGLHAGAGGDAEGIQARTEVSLSPWVPSRPDLLAVEPDHLLDVPVGHQGFQVPVVQPVHHLHRDGDRRLRIAREAGDRRRSSWPTTGSWRSSRRVSSDTFAIFANASTSDSVSFGLLSTAAATSLLESRMSCARCPFVPFMASFIRCMIDSVDRTSGSAFSSVVVLRGRGIRVGIDERPGVGGRLIAGADASRREELAHLIRHVRAREERLQGLHRQRVERGVGACRDRCIGIVGEEDEQRELLVRARREGAFRGHQPDVARHFAPAEEINQRRAVAGLHEERLPDVLGHRVLRERERADLAGRAERLARPAVDRERERAGVADLDDGAVCALRGRPFLRPASGAT